MKTNKLIFILLCGFAFAAAAKGPEYRSLRVHGMGGAFVAVADNKDALYYNPAGLNLINRLGNFEYNPDMGYMPRQRFELKIISLSFSLPANEITDMKNVCGTRGISRAIKNSFFFNFSSFGDMDWCPTISDIAPDNAEFWTDSLAAHQELAQKLTKLDHRLIEIGTQISFLEFAMHNFGFSVWSKTAASPYIDLGVILPYFGYDPIQLDIVAQTAFAFSPVENWSVGLGFKTAKRYKQPRYDFFLEYNPNSNDVNYQKYLDSLENRWDNFAGDSLLNFKNINFALDFGVLYQITRQIRLGSSLRNVFFSKLAGEDITPNWSIGAMASPMILQSNSWWERKINFAMDFADILDGTLGSMFFSHLNFGTEIEQTIVPAIFNVKAGTGFEGGYFAFNVALGFINDVIVLRGGSHAEERGSKTGQKEQRFWTGELSIGF
jgi:hypothetical protein